jgi:hypothetical protein
VKTMSSRTASAPRKSEINEFFIKIIMRFVFLCICLRGRFAGC